MTLLRSLGAAGFLAGQAAGHGAIVWPRSRNAVDGDVDGPSPLSPCEPPRRPSSSVVVLAAPLPLTHMRAR